MFSHLCRMCYVLILLVHSSIISSLDIRNIVPSPDEVLEMATLSSLAWYRQKDGKKVIPADCSEISFINTEGGVEVLIILCPGDDDKNRLAVSFCGSNDDEDWISNIDFFQERFGPKISPIPSKSSSVRVHGGIHETLLNGKIYEIVEDIVLNTLNDEELNVQPMLYLTGHSRGGANAQLLAADFAFRNPDVAVSSIVFGSPRVGNEEFKGWSNNLKNFCNWRVVYENDCVARLPGHFWHTGHLLQLEEGGAQAFYHQTGEGDFLGAPDAWDYKCSISHHGLDRNYIPFLEDVATFGTFQTKKSESCPWWKFWC